MIGVPGGLATKRLSGKCGVHHTTVSLGIPLVAGTHLTDTFVGTFYAVAVGSVTVGD